ncbi:MAG: OB-fold putative lipoprotein [Bacteroidota bacterium]|nr:OB-fold putative lipoprotein [Bacteroidota bacterium]
MKRKIILIGLAVALIAGAIGAYLYFKPTPDIVQGQPDVAVKAGELIAAFEKDSAAARSLYIDKIVAVTGTVKSIDTSGAVILGEEGSPSEVVVGLDRRHMQDHQQLKKGEVATVQGICSGYSTGGGSDPDDLLASLGTTVQLRSAGVKSN